MKQVIAIIVLLMCGTLLSLSAQEVPKEVMLAFKKGDASLLDASFNDEVECFWLSTVGKKTTAQGALKALDQFFSQHQVSDFSVLHKGTRNEAFFAIATLQCEKENFE